MYGVSLGAVALAFAALPSVVDKVVIGMRKVRNRPQHSLVSRYVYLKMKTSLSVRLRRSR